MSVNSVSNEENRNEKSTLDVTSSNLDDNIIDFQSGVQYRNFKSSVSSLSEKVLQYRDIITSEQHTKNAFIEPFLRSLGYDTFCPTEVIPEFTSDFGTKKGEKVDYAILIDRSPILLIEAKDCHIDLSNNEISQLYRYFSVSSVKLALLTNGVEYWFFTDNSEANKMDKVPFFRFSILNYTESDLSKLFLFHKGIINVDNIKSIIPTDKFREALLGYLSSQLIGVSDDFIMFIQQEVGFHGVSASTAKSEIQSILNEFLKIDTGIHKPVSPNTEQLSLDIASSVVNSTSGNFISKGITGSFQLSKCKDGITRGSKPVSFTIDSTEYTIPNWYSMLERFIEYYIDVLKKPEQDLLDYRVANKPFFIKTPSGAEKRLKHSNGIWFSCNFSSDGILSRLRRLAKHLDIPADSIVITTQSIGEFKPTK